MPIDFHAQHGVGHAPDAQDYDGRTPAHLAALEGHVKLLEALLADGADPSLLDRCPEHAFVTSQSRMQTRT